MAFAPLDMLQQSSLASLDAADSSPSSTPCRTILVTGGAGFIGTNFVYYWVKHHPGDRLIVLDALTYAGCRHNLSPLEENASITFAHGNICDRPLVEKLLASENVDTLIHFAAESHVDRSIAAPDAFIRTNVVGTYTVLDAFRHHWNHRGQPAGDRFVHISTDEVYGSLSLTDPPFTETTAYAPNSPYSASKAGGDHLVRAYFKTYNLPTLITNCSNNYGPYQYPEKLIPLMTMNGLHGKPLPVYGDGRNVRDWIYVEDHCRAIDSILNKGKPGEAYNIGGETEIANIDLVRLICKHLDEMAIALPVRPVEQLITFVEDRPGHDFRYAMDATKLRTTTGWRPLYSFEHGLRETIQWYVDHSNWWKRLSEIKTDV
ncbi:MAG: dTDP-glucose 4,6-dehydratase [Leptolyngbyaceae bacterium]|nr:dTDP-glucose 4,6-dehydratase [Leptolyngbyaceae bacterium]